MKTLFEAGPKRGEGHTVWYRTQSIQIWHYS